MLVRVKMFNWTLRAIAKLPGWHLKRIALRLAAKVFHALKVV